MNRAIILTITGALWLVPASGRQDAGARTSRAAILRHDVTDVGAQDLRWGNSSPDRAPQPPFTFISEDASGTNPKVRVRDARGSEWSVKFPSSPTRNEVHAEIAAGRLMW